MAQRDYLISYRFSHGNRHGYGMLSLKCTDEPLLRLIDIIGEIQKHEGYDVVIPVLIQEMAVGEADKFAFQRTPNKLTLP